MTYEQASARGLSFARSDKTVMTYRDGVMHHANAAIVTAITRAKNRERLLRDFLEYRRSAIAEGEKATAREYVLLPASDPSRSEALARNLATQGIDVRRADEAFKIGSRDVAAGPYLVSAAQPTSRLIRNLLEPKIDQPAHFPKRQEERRARRQADQIYDITAWSLPLLYDVELVASPAVLTVKTTAMPMTYDPPRPTKAVAPAKVGYLMPWGTAAAAVTVDALQQGLRVRSIGGAFTLNGWRFPIGTALFRTAENPTDLATRLSAIASRHGGELIPIDSSFVESGTSLGSSDNAFLKPPRVLLVWDTPTAALSAGWTRFVLERRFGQPVTAVRAASLARAVFADFDVIILPSGNYAGVIGDAVVNRLKDWLRGGGTLITMAEATRWATTSTVGLLDTTPLLKDGKPDVPPSGPATGAAGAAAGNASAAGPAFDYDKAIQPDRERPASQPGAILRVTIDTEHWLSAGSDEETQAMIEGQRVFAPIKLNSGRNVGVYAKKDRLIASGLVWPETQDLLVQKAFLMHQPAGQGHVVAFAEEPNYRGFSEASMLLFMNAVLLGPGY
jgi:hypothetical protein